jgi:hypothetical protein
MLLMDRHNLFAPGWSHVLSNTNDHAQLEELRVRLGAPARAHHLGRRWPHLDLKLEARARALVDPSVRVFQSTSDLLRFVNAHQV